MQRTRTQTTLRTLCVLAALAVLAAAPLAAAHVVVYHGSFELTGGQEVPPVDSPFSGNCAVILDGNTLDISCTSDIPVVSAAHIHAGFTGEAGPVIVPLDAGRVIVQEIDLTDEQVATLVTHGAYVNLHTEANPGGEIRGQIHLQQVENTFDLAVRGGADSEVPPANSPATAACRVLSDDDADPTMRVVCTHTVENPTAAHVHTAPPGENGPVTFAFNSPESPLVQTFDLTTEQQQDLEDGNFYVNIHSDAFPGGEARANLIGCVSDDHTLCLNDFRFRVDVTVVDPADGSTILARARRLSSDSGTFSFFSPDNKEILAKVLDGCEINGYYWVFFAATTDLTFDLTVFDTVAAEAAIYSNDGGAAAETVTDTTAFLCNG